MTKKKINKYLIATFMAVAPNSIELPILVEADNLIEVSTLVEEQESLPIKIAQEEEEDDVYPKTAIIEIGYSSHILAASDIFVSSSRYLPSDNTPNFYSNSESYAFLTLIDHKFILDFFMKYDVASMSESLDGRSYNSIMLENKHTDYVDNIFKLSDTIFVQSVGNNGNYSGQQEPVQNNLLLRNDTQVMVGEAIYDPEENRLKKVKSSSRKNSISFITVNPFSQGYSYAYHFEQSKIDKINARYELCKDNFTPKISSIDNLYETIYEDCLHKYGLQYIDQNGYSYNIRGTSFTAPAVAGFYSDMRYKYPELSEYDIVAASYIAAAPINSHSNFSDSDGTGFGYLDQDVYYNHVEKMNAMLSSNPDLKTERIWASSGNMSQTGRNGGIYIDFEEDIFPIQTMIKVRFKDSQEDAKIGIASADGRQAIWAFTATTRDNEGYSLISTPGFFGVEPKGKWSFHAINNEILELELTIAGTQRNSLVEQYQKVAIANGAKSKHTLDKITDRLKIKHQETVIKMGKTLKQMDIKP